MLRFRDAWVVFTPVSHGEKCQYMERRPLAVGRPIIRTGTGDEIRFENLDFQRLHESRLAANAIIHLTMRDQCL